MFFHCDQLVKGAYSVYLRRWLHAFPRRDVLVLRLEDYARRAGDANATAAAAGSAETAGGLDLSGGPSGREGVARALAAVQAHLGLDPAPAGTWQAMVAAPVARGHRPHDDPYYEGGRPEDSADIEPALRAKIAAFYAPFDAELDELLGEPGFSDWHTPRASSVV